MAPDLVHFLPLDFKMSGSSAGSRGHEAGHYRKGQLFGNSLYDLVTLSTRSLPSMVSQILPLVSSPQTRLQPVDALNTLKSRTGGRRPAQILGPGSATYPGPVTLGSPCSLSDNFSSPAKRGTLLRTLLLRLL